MDRRQLLTGLVAAAAVPPLPAVGPRVVQPLVTSGWIPAAPYDELDVVMRGVRRYQVEQICRIFGVPPELVSGPADPSPPGRG